MAYSCEVPAKVENLKNVKIIENFEFSSVQNLSLSVSPFAEKYMDNIQEVGDKYDNLLRTNLSIYILENSQIFKSNNQYFNISGIINDPKPKFENASFTLLAKTENEAETGEGEINCTVIDIIDNNYTLNCLGDKNVNYSLQNSMAFIDDEMLILNFDENENSTMYFEDENNKYLGIKFFNKNEGLNAGGIVAIILVIILVLAAFIAVFICLRKPRETKVLTSESTIVKIKS